MTELVVLLDDKLKSIGIHDKQTVHGSDTPLHLGFSLFLFNQQNQLLLQQRAMSKITWPGVWSNSVCGHPMPGEAVTQAAVRRLKYELGIVQPLDEIQLVLSDYRYQYSFGGITENEHCPVMVTRYDGPVYPNAQEVAATRWVDWEEFLTTIRRANKYSEWCVEEAELLSTNTAFKDFLSHS